jgi:hypothetical protein
MATGILLAQALVTLESAILNRQVKKNRRDNRAGFGNSTRL